MFSKRKTLVVTVLIVISGLFVGSLLSNRKESLISQPKEKKQAEISGITVENKSIPVDLELGGYLSALNKIEIFAEVSGTLQSIPKQFRPGTEFNEGETLIKVNSRVYRNNLLAQKSSLLNQLTLLLPDLSIDFPSSAKNWENYLRKFDLNRSLAELPEPRTQKEKFYVASRNIYNLFYTIKSMEETLSKYTIKAPYSGIVTQSGINPGTLVRAGQKLGEFTSVEIYELEASAGINDIQYLNAGDEVQLKSEDIEGDFIGSIQRINPVIDKNFQTVKVYIYTKDKRLKDGMYLTAYVTSTRKENIAYVPRNFIVNSSQVYVLEDNSRILRNIEVLGQQDDLVMVKGLEDGTKIINN